MTPQRLGWLAVNLPDASCWRPQSPGATLTKVPDVTEGGHTVIVVADLVGAAGVSGPEFDEAQVQHAVTLDA